MIKKDLSKKPIPLSNILFLHKQNKLFLNPEYQRDSVWTRSQKQLLIDSIFHKIDIPKLYFRDVAKAGYEYEVVDGQQRVRAIVEFMENEYPMSDESDKVNGIDISGEKFNKLNANLQMEFNSSSLDVVIMNLGYTDDDIEEMFLRLQNGTPLNAPEKRRAITGNMREVVKSLAKHKIFKLCAFSNKRYAYEDVSAKILHLQLNGSSTDIKPNSIRKTYEKNTAITVKDKNVVKVKNAFNFICKCVKKNQKLGMKKYAVITLSQVVINLLENYDITNHKDEFINAYINFEIKRRKNEELTEDKQEGKLAAYTDATRADSPAYIKYRYDTLLTEIVQAIPDLLTKDPKRLFTEEQRIALYWIHNGICAMCKEKFDLADCSADHIKAHSKGGKTKLSNGQLLCNPCNAKKNNKSVSEV